MAASTVVKFADPQGASRVITQPQYMQEQTATLRKIQKHFNPFEMELPLMKELHPTFTEYSAIRARCVGMSRRRLH